MKSPAEQKIIQIDITNACTHRCANCTRFCGHQRQPFLMDYDTFKKAVDSLLEYPGMIGVMGGEPTLHPNFAVFAEYLAEKTGLSEPLTHARQPIRDFNRHKLEFLSDLNSRRGLWTSLGERYYRHFELIQDVFGYQCINDHSNSGLHQALLISRKELGIPDEEWIRLRDDCWIQKYWSASVTPKGAFFCEVAGALDMLFDGPGGWPIEPGWWRRSPEQFGGQLQWCELCSAALNVPRSSASSEVDDVSPLLLEKLRGIGSPKVAKGKVRVFDVGRYSPDDHHHEYYTEWYLPGGDNSQRVGATNRSIYPRKLDLLTLRKIEECDQRHFDTIAKSMAKLENPDWITAFYQPCVLAPDFRKRIMNMVLNPGCIYFYSSDFKSQPALAVRGHEFPGFPYFILFNPLASGIKGNNVSWQDWQRLFSRYPPDKIVPLGDTCDQETDVIPPFLERRLRSGIMLSHVLSLWKAMTAATTKIAVFPGGLHTKWLLRNLQKHKLTMPKVIVDDQPMAESILGVPVLNGAKFDHRQVDIIYVCNYLIAERLLDSARSRWPENKIVFPYEFFANREFDEEWAE